MSSLYSWERALCLCVIGGPVSTVSLYFMICYCVLSLPYASRIGTDEQWLQGTAFRCFDDLIESIAGFLYSSVLSDWKAAVRSLRAARTLQLSHGFWLGKTQTVFVRTSVIYAFLMNPVNDLAYSSMLLLDASKNIFCLTKMSWCIESDWPNK